MNESIDGALPEFTDTDHSGVAHRILGSLMPALEVRLEPGQSVISQGGEMTWLDPNIEMTTKTAGAGASGLGGVLKRALAGGSIFMTQFTAHDSPAKVAFAAKMPGHIRPISVDTNREYMVSRHGFLAATPNVNLEVAFQQSLGVGIFSGNGFFMQHIWGQGTAWIELSGETVTYELGAGESILVHPGHIGLFESTVNMTITRIKGIKNMLFGAETIFLAQLSGPGKVYLQTLTLPSLAHSVAPYIATSDGGSKQSRSGTSIGGFNMKTLGGIVDNLG